MVFDKSTPITYVLETTGIAGGHKVVFEHVNWLKRHGYNVNLWALSGNPDWFPLEVEVGRFPHYPALLAALKDIEGIKVATWWKTADPVYESCLDNNSIPFYLVQDIETSYYDNDIDPQKINVMKTYQLEDMNFFTTSDWVTKELKKLLTVDKQKDVTQIYLGIDLEIFKENNELVTDKRVAFVSRSHFLKNAQATLTALSDVSKNLDLQVVCFGQEPIKLSGNAYFVYRPTDNGVADIYRTSRLYVATSVHEGYNLPILEAMACGCPVVTTLADGNNHFCVDGKNCLIVGQNDSEGLNNAIIKVLTDDNLARTIRAGGIETAKEHTWDRSMNLVVDAFSKASERIN